MLVGQSLQSAEIITQWNQILTVNKKEKRLHTLWVSVIDEVPLLLHN